MLITCFQCRQQAEVPEECAGKRVRCPHCQYVIVAPAAPKADEATHADAPTPVTALPSMDLDVGTEQPVETKVAPMPLPPIPPTPIPVLEPAKSKPKKYDDDLPPVPAIDRPTRRRATMTPLPKPGAPWGKIIGIGAIILLVLIGVVAGVVSSRSNRPRIMVKNPPPMMFPNGNMPPNIILPQPGFVPQGAMLPWVDFIGNEERFKAKFPMNPMRNNNQNMNGFQMTTYQSNWADWAFTIAHRSMPANEFQLRALDQRSGEIRQHFINAFGANQDAVTNWIQLGGIHQGFEWDFFLQNENRRLFVRAFFVADGNRYHQYVLTAKPQRIANFQIHRNHPDVMTFFNSFQAPFGLTVPSVGSGQLVYEERDDLNHLNHPGRRDNEFMALALHPTKPIAALGTVDGNICVASAERKTTFPTRDGKPVRQIAVSPDGHYLAFTEEKEIMLWNDWDNPAANRMIPTAVPGERCAFTKNQRLLVSSKHAIKEYDCQNLANLTATLDIPDFPIAGFALSNDQQTLALYGDSAIELWHWPDKRKLGRIDAHEAAITTVAFSPDGKTLASAGVDRWIRLWNVDTRIERAAARQHAWTVWSLAFTPAGDQLVSAGLDGMVLLWALQPADMHFVWAESHQYPVRAVAFDNAKNCYLTCKNTMPNQPVAGRKWTRQLRKIPWNEIKQDANAAARTIAQRAGLRLPGTAGAHGATQLAPDGKTIVTVDDPNASMVDTTRRVWDAATATVRHSFPAKPGGYFTPGGEWFLFLNSRSQLQLLDLKTLTTGNETLPINGNLFPQIAFAPTGKSVWIEQNNQFHHYQLPDFKRLQPPVKLKDPNQRVEIMPSLDRNTFLVEATLMVGLQRKRTMLDSTDGKPAKLIPGAPSQVVRLRRDLNGYIQLEDVFNGISQNIGQQRHPMLPGYVSRDRKFGVTGESRPGQMLHMNLWDLQARRPLLTLPEVGATLSIGMRFSDDGKQLALMTNAGWTRIMPTDWLLERQGLLACNPNDVAGP